MKLFQALIIFILLQNCSFDNKTGIWKNNSNTTSDTKNTMFDDFRKLSTENQSFKKIISYDRNYKLEIKNPITPNSWNDIYFDSSNNSKNFNFNEQNQLSFRSKKFTKYKINDFILYDDNKIITSDEKGNLIIFSILESLQGEVRNKKYYSRRLRH